MKVHDPIYGEFCIPEYLVPLVEAPEVRRLSQIRLLNTLTPSLATLGELRRFSHTLGIIYLADLNLHLSRCADEKEAFLAAVLLHDIGTPPFGHLLEYHLNELFGWNHEKIIEAILWTHHVPEGRAHQIYARRTVAVRKTLANSRIDMQLVKGIIAGEHPLSKLLFGTLDFDNLDNVARMNWALGVRYGNEFSELAKHLGVNECSLTLPEALRPAAQTWSKLRRRAYEIIVFDAPTVAAQAVLSAAIRKALEAGVITKDDWTLSDEQLLDVLLNHPATKREISGQYLGRLPRCVYQVQIAGSLQDIGLADRGSAIRQILQSLPARARRPALGYVFIDRGTFEKRISLVDPLSGSKWELGKKSESVVLYAFVPHTAKLSHQTCMAAVESLLSALKVDSDRVMRCEVGSARNTAYAQRALDIETSQS